jgi:hypothetical protein
VAFVPVISLLKQMTLVLMLFFYSFQATETIFMGTQTQKRYLGFWPFFCNLLFEKMTGVYTILLPCLVSELQEQLSPEFELRTCFQCSDLSKISS